MIILILIAFHLNKHYEMFKLYQFTAATRAFYHFTPRIQPSFLLRHFSVQNSIPTDPIKPIIKKPRKIRSPQPTKPKLDHSTSQEAKQPIEQNAKPLVKPMHNPPSQKDHLHQQLISFAMNNKKQLVSKQIDQSLEGKEDLHAMLKKLNRMKKDYLIKTTNDSLIAICTNPLFPSSKRLLKQYFNLLQDHSKHLSRKDSLNLIKFVYKLQLEDFQEGQTSILKCLSKRLCDIFQEAANEPNPKFQQTNTIDIMEHILESPHRILHQQLLKLILEDSRNPDLSLSWPEQARMKKLVKVNEEQPNLYLLLSKEFHVKLLANWQRTQGISKDLYWPQSPEERAVKELTQALVDRFVTSPTNVDNIVTKSNYSKEQRIFVFPILAKYRGTVGLKETYLDVLTRLQMGLVVQLTHTSKLTDRMWNLVTVLYFTHRSDLEPIHQKGKVEQGEIVKTNIPYQCSVLPQIDAVFRQEVFKTEQFEKPDLLRYKLSTRHFMMMSWLIANVIKNDSTPEFRQLVERLQEAHTYLLKETPEADLFDPSVAKFLLQFYNDENTVSRDYLKKLCQAKLFDRKNGLQEASDKIELGNIILDCIPELDSQIVAQQHKQFTEQLLSAIYYGQALTQTSLFFYRCKHLERVLETLSRHHQFSKERDFWLKSEDMVLRQREMMCPHKLCQLAHIYSRVNPSQLFWVEIEKTLLSKSSDFVADKETADSVYKVLVALSAYNRRNETFQKVFGNIMSKVKEEFSERELIVLTSILETSNAQNLFKELDRLYLSQETYLLPGDPELVAKLAIALKRHNATNHYPMGEQKFPLFSLALKFLIVQVADLQEAKLGDTDVLLKQIKQISEVEKHCKEVEQNKEAIQLKKVLQMLCRQLIEKINMELQTAVQDNLVKLKVSLVQIGYDISDSKQHSVQRTQPAEHPQRTTKDGPNDVKSTLFKNHPKFRNDNRSRSR